SPQQKKYVNTIRNATSNLLTIVNDILDISKLETGQIIFEEKPFNLRKLVEKIVTITRPEADAKKLSVGLSVDTKIPHIVFGDAMRLNQILLNLIYNAIKFTRKGEISIRVELKENAKDAMEIEFSVKDTGIGIPPSYLENIFDSFTQASPEITRK